MSLGLNDDAPISSYTPEPRHRSAGLAFALSVLIPGAGQFYCGKMGRGGMTLGFWVLGLLFCFTRVSNLVGLGILLMTVLWISSFLDAYFTAIEINRGIDDQVDVQNPRVALTLNLLTAGFGYFYLGERTKGITLFIVMQVSRLLFLKVTGLAGGVVSVSLLVLQLSMAADAYRIARRQLKETLVSEPVPAAVAAPASRLPVHVPIALAGFLTFGFVVLAVIGLVLGAGRAGKRPANALLRGQRRIVVPSINANSYDTRDATPVPAVDLPTAVQNVQQVQRKTAPLKIEDIPNLQQDVRVLSSVLGAKKIDPADAMVARFFRGVARAMINIVNDREGNQVDAGGARAAVTDFDKVISGGPDTAHTYVPAVSVSNAQYWAGIVERNQLHDEASAYAYWEKCAGAGHAGCMNNVAGARITGAGREKIDLHEALDLYTIVFNSGTKYHCAGALSAMSIAYINYFTGVKRPSDDDLEWTQKADGLFDKLEAAENNRDVCQRSDAEVDEFLLQLSHGHRDDNILQDALSRLDEDSKTTKAVIQFISGATDEAGLNAVVQGEKSPGMRCSAYFSAMWYAELHKEDALARRYYQRLADIGKFHCGEPLVFAGKFKF